MLTLEQQKQNLRDSMRALRIARREENRVASAALARLFIKHIDIMPNAVIAGYLAFRDEIDPAILLEMLQTQGHQIALPVIVGKGLPLQFRLYRAGDRLAINAMGIGEPPADAPPVEPDIVVTPLLAFDAARNRLGYGGGYYDRTLADLRRRKPVTAIGIGYDFQRVEQVPTEPHDVALDHIVTDLNVF